MERRFPFQYFEEFDDLETVAKKSGVGLWSSKEVKDFMDELSDEEEVLLEEEQEENYQDLQQELLSTKCEEEDGLCTEQLSWSKITEKNLSLKVTNYVS